MAAELKGVDKKVLNEYFSKLPIRSKLDIALSPLEICKILKVEAGSFLKPLISDLEYQIVDGKVENTKESITEYIQETYTKEI